MGEMREVEARGATRARVRRSLEKLRRSSTIRQSTLRSAQVAANRRLNARELLPIPEGDACTQTPVS